ncbi:hypothetical protein PG993_012412 [Apiospora rasikravindrae]|uniref:Uncharacterized protein n=1 Tax=Apiospora rasikravindrae TaxID=990691 RepID=A0ABR1S2G6_9PEZI
MKEKDTKSHAFKSPNPSMSRVCLVLSAIVFTAILMARHHRDQIFEPNVPVENYGFWWAKMIGAFAGSGLLIIHGILRCGRYKEKHGGDFYRASPACAGAVGVCAMLLYNIVFCGQDFPQYFWAYQAEMWFWVCYWAEWWTAPLGCIMEDWGC